MCYMFYMALNGFCLRCSVHRIVSSTHKKNNKKTDATLAHKIQDMTHGCIKLNTHAETTVLRSNWIVLSYTGKECEVSLYSPDYKAVHNVPVVTGATVWTNPQDGTAILLVFHEALWMGDKLDHTLVNPNQLRAYGVNVQDSPFMWTLLAISDQDHIISLYSQGTIICGDTRSPMEQELGMLPRMVMTSPHDWDQHNIVFPSCSCQVNDEVNPHDKLMAVETLLQHTIYDPLGIVSLILAHVCISEVNNSTRQNIPSSCTFQSKE